MKYTIQRLIAAGAFYYATIVSTSSAHGATLQMSDISAWVGSAAGPGVSQAALVIDWADASPAWVWGYRWDSSLAKTGADLLAAIVGADSRLTLIGLSDGFISNIGWNSERFRPGFDAATERYWTYSVNNHQQLNHFTDGAAPLGAHILPPLGSPYDEAGPGTWISSNTGVLGRPLVDGSWDGFYYAAFGSNGPSLPSNAPSVPEPHALLLAVVVIAVSRRHRS